MSNAMQVVAYRSYDPIILFGNCPTSPISNWFDVPQGYHAVIQAYDIPNGWCIEFEERVCICCCKIVNYPVPDGCGNVFGLDDECDTPTQVCLPAGSYQATAINEFGEPETPAPLEAVLKVTITPGPCPTTV